MTPRETAIEILGSFFFLFTLFGLLLTFYVLAPAPGISQ